MRRSWEWEGRRSDGLALRSSWITSMVSMVWTFNHSYRWRSLIMLVGLV